MNLQEFLQQGVEIKQRWKAEGARWQDRQRIKPYELVQRCFQTGKDPRNGRGLRGDHNFKGTLVTSGALSCQKCHSTNMFAGTYDTEYELIMYSECDGRDPKDDERIDHYQFQVCLDCTDYKTKERK